MTTSTQSNPNGNGRSRVRLRMTQRHSNQQASPQPAGSFFCESVTFRIEWIRGYY